jgi:hypothetical protein
MASITFSVTSIVKCNFDRRHGTNEKTLVCRFTLVQTAQVSPELADAADVLSDQLRFHLQRLARFLEPQADKIDRRFLMRLREMGFEPQQRNALAGITPGAAARVLARDLPPLKFIEQVEYNGCRPAPSSKRCRNTTASWRRRSKS